VYDSDDAPNGTADLPLHGGRAPSWLFGRMTNLARAIEGRWAVIQQGMNVGTRYARRYHWLGENVRDFVSDPHAAVIAPRIESVLNLVAGEGGAHRDAVAVLIRTERPETIVAEVERAQEAVLGHPGVGAKTMRALSLAAQVMYGVPANRRDHAVYDGTIACLENAVRRARLGEPDRLAALRRLAERSRRPHGG